MRRFLLVTQVYPPDTAAVGQHMADIAEALARRGHEVTVITSDRGYDDPNQKYQKRETRNGVTVRRLGLTSFGKASMALRLAGGLSLVLQATLRTLLSKQFDALLLTTSPPMGGLIGIVAGTLRRVPFDYWLMDLNPDQAIELGRAAPESLQVRLFEGLNRAILRQARNVITLDEAMALRFHGKRMRSAFPKIIPVWAPGEFPEPLAMGDSAERQRYGLQGRRVVMYAGNHSIAHPLDELFEAVKASDEAGRLGFVFMGGGLAKAPIDAWVTATRPKHVVSLPYQPLEAVHQHLSMSDVQVVVVGPKTVGIVHPSKIYGALAAGRAILVIGPKHSPAARLVAENDLGWVVGSGDLPGLQQALQQIAEASNETLSAMGSRAFELAAGRFSRSRLMAEFLQIVES